MPRSLILEPTRELAAQVAEAFERYGKYHKLTMALLIGGVSMSEQIDAINRGPDVLIATPGRLIDLFERGQLLLNDTRILVIDEADRMLDMGFIPDVEKIVSLVSRIRQTLFFSATMPPEIRRLADKFLINPKEISVTPPASVADTVTQGMIVVQASGRTPARRRSEGKTRRAARFDQKREGEKRAGFLQPQTGRGHRPQIPCPARFFRRRTARRHVPAGAHGSAGKIQERRLFPHGLFGRGGARSRHRQHEPCVQFRRSHPS